MRFKTALGGFIWVDILSVTSLEFIPDSALNNRTRKHIITFTNRGEISTILASGEDDRLQKVLDKIMSAKLADMGIATVGILSQGD